jgi:hypothetical protein
VWLLIFPPLVFRSLSVVVLVLMPLFYLLCLVLCPRLLSGVLRLSVLMVLGRVVLRRWLLWLGLPVLAVLLCGGLVDRRRKRCRLG